MENLPEAASFGCQRFGSSIEANTHEYFMKSLHEEWQFH
jgi:tRNA(Glu) U13 pseudouridine synthase TruD